MFGKTIARHTTAPAREHFRVVAAELPAILAGAILAGGQAPSRHAHMKIETLTHEVEDLLDSGL
jgi:hypothetical protein